MVSDVPVDNEAPVVTSGIFRSAGAQSFRGAHRGRVCVPMFIGVSVRARVGVCVILCNSQGKGCRGLGEAYFLLLELNS